MKTGGLDYKSPKFLDKSIETVKDLYIETLTDEASRVKLFALLEKLGHIDKGFTYRIAYNKEKKCTGFVYMTSGMRSNFERFSSFVCLNAMKRTTNVHMWPYIAIAVMDDMKRTSVVCESFMVEKRHESYVFILQSIFMMAPRVSKHSVKVIFGDEFISQEILSKAGMETTKLFNDHFHLKQNIEMKLGGSYDSVYQDIVGMLQADSKDSFVHNMQLALNHSRGNSKVINLINSLNIRCQNIAAYIIDSTEGSCKQRGSSRSEQNHWSVIAFLSKEFVGELEDILKELLLRQKSLASQTHQLLVKSSYRMKILHRNLEKKRKFYSYQGIVYFIGMGIQQIQKGFLFVIQRLHIIYRRRRKHDYL